MNVFDLFASLKLDTKEYESNLKQAESQAGTWGKSLEKAALAGVTAIGAVGAASVALTQNTAKNGDEIHKNSQRVGMSYKAYQQWDYIMKINGSSMAENSVAFKNLTSKMDDARGGSKEAQKMFKELGISMKDVKGLSREDMFKLTVKSLQNVKDETKKASLANDMFGKSGQKLMPLFNSSSEELDKLFQETEDYGMLMSDDMVENSAKYEDSMTKLKGTLGGVGNSIAAKIMPKMIEWIEKISGKIREFTSDEEKMKLISDILGGAMRILGKAFEIVGKVIEKVIKWVSKFVQWLKDGSAKAETFKVIVVAVVSALAGFLIVYEVIKVLGLLTTAINVLGGALKFLAANPMALVVVAITTIIGVLVYLWKTNEGFRDAVKKIWEKITTFFRDAWTAIKNVWGGVKQWFSDVWNGIKETFSNVPGWFKEKFGAAWGKIKEIWGVVTGWFGGVWSGIKNVFMGAPGWFKEKFTIAWGNIKTAWEKVVTWFNNVWTGIKNIFSVVGTWFKDRFSNAWQGIKNVWNGVTNYFRIIWETIKAIFSVVKNVLIGNWRDAWNGIKSIVGTWAGYFRNAWNNIKNVFSGVNSWFGSKFRAAWQSVKNAFSGFNSFFSNLWGGIKNTFSGLGTKIGDAISSSVKSAINTLIRAVESTINSAIRLINRAIDLINKVPLVDVGHVPNVNFPRLARGGVLEKGQVGLLEGSGAEAVVPLENNAKWINKVALDMTKALSGSGTFEQNITINSPKHLSPSEVARQTRLATQNMVLAIRGV